METNVKGMENLESARAFLKQLWNEAGDENSESYWEAMTYESMVEEKFRVRL